MRKLFFYLIILFAAFSLTTFGYCEDKKVSDNNTYQKNNDTHIRIAASAISPASIFLRE